MSRLFRIISILTLLFVFFLAPMQAYAQEKIGVYDNIPDSMDAAAAGVTVLTGTVGETKTADLMYTLEYVAGAVPGKTTNSDDLNYINQLNRKSAIGTVTNMGIALYANPPANLALWVRDTGQTLGFIPRQAYAQGVGVSALSGILPLWKAFRNVSYLLLAVALIVIGFMVMLRKKIDPKTVVTVQSALPQIVITLLLITFSYAIVGLMIDIMYFLILILAVILVPASNGALPDDTAKIIISNGGIQLWRWVFGGGFRALDDVLAFLNPISAFSVGTENIINQGPRIAVLGFVNTLLGAVEGVLLSVVLAVLFLFAFARILGMLVSAYIQIIINVIFAPLFLLVDAFPGGEGFSNWMRNLTANMLVFPATAALFMVVRILNVATMGVGPNGESIQSSVWSPPILFPGGQYGLTGVIGLGMLLAIPKLVGSIKEALKAKPAVGFGMGSGGATAMQILSGAYYVKSLAPGLLDKLFPKRKE